jgi:hypothetical protein
VCVCVDIITTGVHWGGEAPQTPPTGVGMQLGPGRSPCRREATVTTLPKTVCLTWSHREQQAKNFSTMMPSVRRNLHSRTTCVHSTCGDAPSPCVG